MFRALSVAFLLAAMPSSSSYVLNAYGFSNGSGAPGSSNYKLSGSAGDLSGPGSSASFKLPAGIKASTTVPAPPAPTFVNPSSNYDRLNLTLNVGTFPTDTKYLIAISNDGFATTNYVQPDNTVGSGLSISNYQTYAAWGGSSGFFVLGLSNSTTYTVKVAALQGSFTGSGFGPTASAVTSVPSVTFALSTSLTSTPPFTTNFASLPAGSVTSGGATITGAVTTNALGGGAILVRDQYGGFFSTSSSYTLPSATADLGVAAKGYGAQITAVSQSSGGPMAKVSPYNGSSNSVGALTTSLQPLASFASPVTSGSVTLGLLAKTDITVPSAADYSDTITLSLNLVF